MMERKQRTSRGWIRWSGLIVVVLLAGRAMSATDQEARVQRKAQQVQERAKPWVEAGGDQQSIDRLAQQVDPAVKAGDLTAAEAALDKILAIVGEPSPGSQSDASGPHRKETPARLAPGQRVPADAEIVYAADGYVYVMKADGTNVTQVTFDHRRQFEHVTVSPDRRWITGNEQGPPTETGQSTSKIWLFDLESGKETQLLPNFKMAGNGGHLHWDSQGFIYFAGVEKLLVAAPKSRADFIANAGANDVYKVKYDGTGLTRLTRTPDRGEADVALSSDGTLVTFMDNKIQPPNDYTEIWVMNSDGTNPRLVYKGGRPGVDSVHDPAFSPDNKKIVFSKVNPKFKNFSNRSDANTAHDIYSINIDGTGLTRITKPGPISVAPDWHDDLILYLELTDREKPPYLGLAVIRPDGTGHRRIKANTNIGKWIPKAR